MKTIVMEGQAVGNPIGSAVGYGHDMGLSFAPRPSNREWLPVPAGAVKPSVAAQGRRLVISRIHEDALAENKMMGLLLLAASAGVAYGFWMLTQLVENWAAFQTGISRLVE